MNFFLKQTLLVLFSLSASILSAQSIRFKSDFEDAKSSTTFKFETASFSGSLSATNTIFTLKIKNSSDSEWSNKEIQLVDFSNKAVSLCPGITIVVDPGETKRITYSSCSGDRGLFRLKNSYSSKAAFKEDALFLCGKEWKLTVGDETFTFYTDI
jgi:hypothetical protein